MKEELAKEKTPTVQNMLTALKKRVIYQLSMLSLAIMAVFVF